MAEYKKTDKGWSIRFYFDGGRKQKGGFKTKKEATAWMEHFVNGYASAHRLIVQKEYEAMEQAEAPTVREIMEIFFDNYCEMNVDPSTKKRYKESIIGHILPLLGDMKAKDVTPITVTDFYKTLHNPPWNLADQTIRNDHSVLSQAYKYAMRLEILDKNPCAVVSPPSGEKKEIKILNESQIATLLHYVRDVEASDLYMPVFLALTTGMRAGEVCGLQDEEVNFTNRIIYIRHQLKLVDNVYQLCELKTKSSRRSIVILKETIPELRAYSLKKKELALSLGKDYAHNHFFCRRKDGRPITPRYIDKAFKRVATKLGLDITFHGLRHTHATLLFKQHVHPKIVSERLGHARIQITLDLYTHFIPGLQEQVMDDINFSLINSNVMDAKFYPDIVEMPLKIC